MNGLETTYESEVNFYRLDAAVSENEAVQSELGLRGHPSVAIIDPEGTIVYRYFGAQSVEVLTDNLEEIISTR